MSKKNKVLLLSHIPPPTTGIGSWTKKILKLGLGEDWDIVLVNTNTINGRDPFKNNKRSFIQEWKRSKNIWRQEEHNLRMDTSNEIKVVHTCIPCTPFGIIREIQCAKIARKYKRKFILHCRCTVPNVVNNKLKILLFKKLAKLCDGIIVLNQKSFDFVSSICDTKVITIPNFAESELLNNKDEIKINKDLKNLVYVGGVIADKGCDRLIEVAKLFPNLDFHLIGIVANNIKKMEITKNVILYGNLDNEKVKKMIQSNDCFMFLSRYWGEGFSNALVEAMSAGLPCIVTDWAANKDMIEEKGGIVINDDIRELKEAILKMYDYEFRVKCSQFNLKKVKNNYIDKVVIPQYVNFYEQIIKGVE